MRAAREEVHKRLTGGLLFHGAGMVGCGTIINRRGWSFVSLDAVVCLGATGGPGVASRASCSVSGVLEAMFTSDCGVAPGATSVCGVRHGAGLVFLERLLPWRWLLLGGVRLLVGWLLDLLRQCCL